MEKSYNRKLICYFLFNCLTLISLNLCAQEICKPVHKSISLSGNFGELRATHFHSGIDIRTGGMEGLPVLCVKAGQVVRISVSPTGYGQALYIEHPDGTTSVYGHLQRFNPRITEIVRKIQYEQESFKIDENVRNRQLFFRQGDTVAYSGNTGSSGGPHLHFEIRNTETEHTINPLLYYKINDTKSPIVRKLYLYRESPAGCVELLRQIPVKTTSSGHYKTGQLTIPEGRIGIAVFVTDYMNDSWNKLGVYRLSLNIGQDTFFYMQADSCSFEQNCFVNDLKDFEYYKKNETVYRCFGNYQEHLFGVRNKDKGWITVKKDSIVSVEIRLSDINGNQTKVTLTLKGKESVRQEEKEENILKHDQAHTLELPGIRVEIAPGSLASSIRKELKIEKDTVSGRNIFVLAEKDVPLLKKAHLFISGKFEKNSLVCEIDRNGKKYPVDTRWDEEGLKAEIGYLNRYTIVEDVSAPTISFLGKFPDGSLKFKVKDDFSGIAFYRGEVNGKWCLFSYDPRYDLLKCNLDEPVFISGQIHEVKVMVEDQTGNRNEIRVKVKK